MSGKRSDFVLYGVLGEAMPPIHWQNQGRVCWGKDIAILPTADADSDQSVVNLVLKDFPYGTPWEEYPMGTFTEIYVWTHAKDGKPSDESFTMLVVAQYLMRIVKKNRKMLPNHESIRVLLEGLPATFTLGGYLIIVKFTNVRLYSDRHPSAFDITVKVSKETEEGRHG